ncbi:MAG: hypothetical protein CVT95_09445 [Bacteroidetes bacterium HGW-Bacteroidetes-12]|nr:MAG: hypothetical protein CVT95_09445 [Bacteroidetes bacterium HGW-Bacteroidetes-12]
MNKSYFSKIKPIHKFMLIGVLPLLIIVVVFAKQNTSLENNSSEASQSPFMEAPTERDTFSNKSNIELYKEHKYSNSKGNSFGGALDIEVSKPKEDTLFISEEKEDEERLREKKISTSKSSTNSYSSNTNQYAIQQNRTTQTIVEENVDTVEQKIRTRTKSSTTTPSTQTNKTTTQMINAVIHNGNKAVKSGSTVRIRITQDCIIKGVEIKRNTIISAIASFSSERIKLSISSLSYNGQYIDTKLTVYDLDGIDGIFVPGGIKEQTKEDVSSSGVDAASGTLPIIGGIAKDVIKKSIKEPSAIIYDNHKITLRL